MTGVVDSKIAAATSTCMHIILVVKINFRPNRATVLFIVNIARHLQRQAGRIPSIKRLRRRRPPWSWCLLACRCSNFRTILSTCTKIGCNQCSLYSLGLAGNKKKSIWRYFGGAPEMDFGRRHTLVTANRHDHVAP